MTLGANFQSDAFVFGVEGDIDYSAVNSGHSATFCTAAALCQFGDSWLSTLRGRAGYAADRILFYATAGGAFGDIKLTANGVTNTTTKAGWTAGAGIESAVADNWTVRIEYLYAALGSATCGTACGGVPVSVKVNDNLIRAGVDFKFR